MSGSIIQQPCIISHLIDAVPSFLFAGCQYILFMRKINQYTLEEMQSAFDMLLESSSWIDFTQIFYVHTSSSSYAKGQYCRWSRMRMMYGIFFLINIYIWSRGHFTYVFTLDYLLLCHVMLLIEVLHMQFDVSNRVLWLYVKSGSNPSVLHCSSSTKGLFHIFSRSGYQIW